MMKDKVSGKIPQLCRTQKGEVSLFVDKKEFFILGGEVHNSSASDMRYMEEYVWKRLPEISLNTLLVPVYWEQIEAVQGEYDFTLVQKLIDRARKARVRLVLLWFGLWKNGASNYVPSWVKRDSKTYFRARTAGGKTSETISPFCEEAVKRDAGAFAAFMRFLRDYDGKEYTVIMVQVENECGFLGSGRDYHARAQEKYDEEVPEAIKEWYQVTGNWEQAFQEQAEDFFMTWYVASAVEKIACAGKKEYSLPLYVNVWLKLFPFRNYPSGGPVAEMTSLWKRVAASIDLICPDIYDPDFYEICGQYVDRDNPLFIPETIRHPLAVSRLFGILGLYHAIGYSPFGIDDILNAGHYDELSIEELDALRVDWHWEKCFPENTKYWKRAYELFDGMKELYFKQKENCRGFAQRNENEPGVIISYDKYDVSITYSKSAECRAGSGGILIPADSDSFYVVGCNARIELLAPRGKTYEVEPVGVWEGTFVQGKFVPGRKLNGDELYAQCRLVDLPSVIKIEAGIYE